MTVPRIRVAVLAVGALVVASATAQAAQDYVAADAHVIDAANRCPYYHPGFIALGNGACARSGDHVRVEPGVSRAASEGWGGRTSSAELRSEGSEFMPGVGTSHQLRVRSGLQTLAPY